MKHMNIKLTNYLYREICEHAGSSCFLNATFDSDDLEHFLCIAFVQE